jgi:hypothetical protein
MPKGKGFINFMLPEETFTYGKKNNYDNPIGYLIGKKIYIFINFRKYVRTLG